jgi:hypothetical protein
MKSEEAVIGFCEKMRLVAMTILIVTVLELILGKILNRLILSPDVGLILIIAGATLASMCCATIRKLRK